MWYIIWLKYLYCNWALSFLTIHIINFSYQFYCNDIYSIVLWCLLPPRLELRSIDKLHRIICSEWNSIWNAMKYNVVWFNVNALAWKQCISTLVMLKIGDDHLTSDGISWINFYLLFSHHFWLIIMYRDSENILIRIIFHIIALQSISQKKLVRQNYFLGSVNTKHLPLFDIDLHLKFFYCSNQWMYSENEHFYLASTNCRELRWIIDHHSKKLTRKKHLLLCYGIYFWIKNKNGKKLFVY